MKRSHLVAIAFLVLAGVPASASVHAGYNDRENRPRLPRLTVETVLDVKSRAEEGSLPLECRGYYLQSKPQRAAISRCE